MSTNATCFKEMAPEKSPPLFQHGNVVFQAHQVGWIVSGFFMMVAIVASFWLINKHLQWYTNKREQRYIVRILFMVPIYAVISFGSYIYWNHATPLLLIRDCYESTVLTAFFYLLLMYLSPDPDEQKDIFRKEGLSRQYDATAHRLGKPPRKWMFPLGFVKWKPQDGYYFLQLMKWAILQYCVIRPVTTLAAVILNYMGLYCEDSWSPRWGQVYITTVVSISVTVAMYCLLQMYTSVSEQLKPQKPLLKLFAVKAVVFLTFWQASLLSVLAMFGWVKDTKYMTADDINTGISAILETFEMMCFAFLHIRAFTYKVYRPAYNSQYDTPPQRTPRLKSLGHALDFRETWREIRDGAVYMVHRWRGVETDQAARRTMHLQEAFGHNRARLTKADVGAPVPGTFEKVTGRRDTHNAERVRGAVDSDADMMVSEGRRRWLDAGRREKSEGLEAEIERELQKKGYSIRGRRDTPSGQYGRLPAVDDDDQQNQQGHGSRKRSFWRSIYDRISQTNAPSAQEYEWDNDIDHEKLLRPSSYQPTQDSQWQYQRRQPATQTLLYDDPPPRSVIRSYRGEKRSRSSDNHRAQRNLNPYGNPTAYEPSATREFRAPPLPASTSYLAAPSARDHRSYLQIPQQTMQRSDSLLQRVFPHSAPHSDCIRPSSRPEKSLREIQMQLGFQK
ncbi:DUF300-domain-containing protein [Punctularia strigosozonata HHB-11173 SS5]|uniref:DUF300-domain-containing protein n=1 Tax=Punctularia strigosozonata (strain HHB-11173) TaxID=741275 RepID=UPI00044175C4|nr:DUF300-domain-containing protein [Punctularia strigosozonata HHB-11173 SS5]EIN06704.1 DUF300-domain-containing protein [Punctularia strigosozonata HHB-11173 SS5]